MYRTLTYGNLLIREKQATLLKVVKLKLCKQFTELN